MYPTHIFQLFPPFPRDNQVFVLVSHAPRFDTRWRTVLEPGIADVGLKPYRVEARRMRESVLSNIAMAISAHRLIIADITEIYRVREGERSYSFRNANVMYGLGMAHAVRQPQEVIIFCSDDSELTFDLGSVKIHRYDPENDPAEARTLVGEVIQNALSEIDLAKVISVRRAADALDYESYEILTEAIQGPIPHPGLDPSDEPMMVTVRIASIFRLLDMGLLASYERLKYSITPFGEAVIKAIAEWV